VRGWFTDDTPKRFEAYGWHVIADVDGHDSQAVAHAFEAARGEPSRPTLICAKTVIGWGSPAKAGKESSHGSPLGADEVAATRAAIGWPHGPFEIPDDIYAGWDHRARGAEAEAAWRKLFDDYRGKYPDEAVELERVSRGELPESWGDVAQAFIDETNAKAATVATRAASQTLLGSIGAALPELLGGSADLAGSNLTLWSGSKGVTADDANGNYVYYGVREFAMAAIMNGVSLHGGLIPYGGTFLMFSEYARNALRMAALMKIRSIYVFTHDSIGLGEDGPTHQAVEQAATLRLMPNMAVWRPADAVETAVAWRAAIERTDGPTSLLLSRQGLAHVTRDAEQLANVSRGGYIVVDAVSAGEAPQVIVIATGSEVGLALEAAQTLVGEGLAVRVVSMPCTSVFDAQTPEYKQQVLPKTVTARVAVEAGVTDYWRKYVGLEGMVIGVDSFGESAPAPEVFKHFGVTAAAVADAARTLATND